MNSGDDLAYAAGLREGCERLNLPLEPSMADALSVHYALVVRWAKKINLTTIVGPKEAAILHGLDSLLFAEFFREGETQSVVDVGSGAGFPGIVLAIVRPQLAMRLLEPVRKKASFLRVALAALNRPDVVVLEQRLIDVRPPAAPSWRADAIVSRATIPPRDLIRMAAPYLNARGRLVLSTAREELDGADIEAASKGLLALIEQRTWTLPGTVERTLYCVERRDAM